MKPYCIHSVFRIRLLCPVFLIIQEPIYHFVDLHVVCPHKNFACPWNYILSVDFWFGKIRRHLRRGLIQTFFSYYWLDLIIEGDQTILNCAKNILFKTYYNNSISSVRLPWPVCWKYKDLDLNFLSAHFSSAQKGCLYLNLCCMLTISLLT